MPIAIIVPRLGWSMEEGAFVAWLKADGSHVQAGEPLFSIEGDKAIQDIESIDSGILCIARNAPKPGDPVHVGDVLGHLLAADEIRSTPSPESSPSPHAIAAPRTELPASPSSVSQPHPSDTPIPEPGSSSKTEPRITPRALRIAEASGVDWTLLKGSGRGGRIRERDVIAAATPIPGTLPRRGVSVADTAGKVLVTGACGFVGTWVVRALRARGLDVLALDVGLRPPRWERLLGDEAIRLPLISGNLLDRSLLARVFATGEVTHVIHLAALLTPDCQHDPWEGCQANVLGTVALFEAMRRAPRPVHGLAYASSVAVFGDEPDTDTAAGASPRDGHPMTFYGAFKKSVETIAAQYWRHFRIPSLGIRPQVAYGPERESGLTAGPTLAARAAARGEPYCIPYSGRVGYDYVEDVAEAFVRGALETPAGALVVDLPGEPADVSQVLSAIARAAPDGARNLSFAGPPVPATPPPRPRFIQTLFPDWKTTSLVEGLRRTVSHYRALEANVSR